MTATSKPDRINFDDEEISCNNLNSYIDTWEYNLRCTIPGHSEAGMTGETAIQS